MVCKKIDNNNPKVGCNVSAFSFRGKIEKYNIYQMSYNLKDKFFNL